ncbi:uncharacterized protein F4822DRAFT_146949 [Hypoxylon trugodes]|uniref:uncharacterized protein n=1 Tax=Hypoxylon trugodes TaxID=326681 RepID=UPI002197E34A|nr:uncharacterized protein F4822DRAFT_146949 [Hypoxylon trugodes]KAI1392962.1 hypothetical protein F4822DRAFT_146949 [Hypoxylon trugodes]
MAWTFISAASDLCQRLGYHRSRPPRDDDKSLRAAQERLFWTIHRMDKGLSFRFGRPSNIRDAEITLPHNPKEPRFTKVARIQGRAYDELYSPAALSRPIAERARIIEILGTELRVLIGETHAEIFDATNQPGDSEADPMRVVYLQCDLVCQYSLLALIWRAAPVVQGPSSVSEDCVAIARETLDIHHQCMLAVNNCKGDPSMVIRYINWAIMHIPFVPFSILFTRAIQLLDFADLARLENFATSLGPGTDSSESFTHPYRLYDLLCKAARIYIDRNIPSSSTDATLVDNPSISLGQFDFGSIVPDAGMVEGGNLGIDDAQMYDLSDWYYSNQQIMNLLDEDLMF